MGCDRILFSFLTAITASLFGSGLIVYGLLGDDMFATTTSESALRIGLMHVCTNNICAPHNFTDVNFVECTLSGSQFEFRFVGVRNSFIAAASLAGLSEILTLIAAIVKASKVLYLGQFALTLAFAIALLAVAFFYVSMERWAFCDKPYCQWYADNVGAGRPCYYWFGTSFACCAGGVVLYMLSTLWSGFTLVAAATADVVVEEEEEDDLLPEDKDGADDDAVEEDEEEAAHYDARSPAAVEPTPAGVPAGYDYDAETGYYYSYETNYYYDTTSGQYYDVDSDTWFTM